MLMPDGLSAGSCHYDGKNKRQPEYPENSKGTSDTFAYFIKSRFRKVAELVTKPPCKKNIPAAGISGFRKKEVT